MIEITDEMVSECAGEASRLAGFAVSEAVCRAAIRRLRGRLVCESDEALEALVLAAARIAAAGEIECDAGFCSRFSAGGLAVGGRSAGEVASALRRDAARVICGFVEGGGVVGCG